jgi:hypothetical protein
MDLSAARQYALTLPEVSEEPHFDYTSFRVRKKIFVTAPPNGEYLHIFVPEELRETACTMRSLWRNSPGARRSSACASLSIGPSRRLSISLSLKHGCIALQ